MAAAAARAEVDASELLLCLLRAEHRFQCAKTALLRAHMRLLEHVATPPQRAAFTQRLLDLLELRPTSAPPLPPPMPNTAPPESAAATLSSTPRQRQAERAAAKKAAAAGGRLHSAVSWAYGTASAAQVCVCF